MCKWGTNKSVKLAYPLHNSKRTEIDVDECMAPLIQLLNDYGIHTLGCCCGHSKAEGIVSILQDNKIIEIRIPIK